MNNISPSRIEDSLRDSRRFAVHFLLAELEMAATFLDVAIEGQVRDTYFRNLHHAIQASQTVDRFLDKLDLEREERELVAERRQALRARLRALLNVH